MYVYKIQIKYKNKRYYNLSLHINSQWFGVMIAFDKAYQT